MIGDELDHLKVITERSNSMAIKVALAPLTRHQARIAFSSIYTPMVTYGLTACSFQKKEMRTMQSMAVEKCLLAMGYGHSFPRDVVHGPGEFGGLNLNDTYTEQCMLKIQSMIEHLRAQSPMGEIMSTNLNWLQLHSGLSQPILESTDNIIYLFENWFLHLRSSVISIQGTLLIKNL